MNLFDFDFTVNLEEVTEEQVQQALNEVVMFYRERGNPYLTRIEDILHKDKPKLSPTTRMLLPILKERGYIDYDDVNTISLKEEYRYYHSPEEIVEMFKKEADELLANGGSHYDLYYLRTKFNLAYNGPGILDALSKTVDEYGVKLGLKHFLEVPESRGPKIDRLNNIKWLVKEVSHNIIPKTSWEEIENYFDTHAFLCDEDRILTTSPGAFICQCLAEAQDEKTIKLIMSYVGCLDRHIRWMNTIKKNYKVVYPTSDV